MERRRLPDLLLLLCELMMLRSGGEIHERDEGRHRGDELEGYHRLSHVVAINAFTQKKEIYFTFM